MPSFKLLHILSFSAILSSAILSHAIPMASLNTRQGCTDVSVVFARGTSETPTIGNVVGPPFQSALQKVLGSKSLSFQGVDYPANVAGILEGGDKAGSATMAKMVDDTAAQCMSSKIVMSGYSQGAMLVHNAAGQIAADSASKVAAVVMFGDPFNGQKLGNGLSAKSKTFCNAGDNVCEGGTKILPPHLAYGSNATAAADFVNGNL